MDKIIMLLETAMETYQVSHQVYDKKYTAIKRALMLEFAKVVSISMVLLVIIIGIIAVSIIGLLAISSYVAEFVDQQWLAYLTPIILGLCIVILVWIKRKSLYFFLTRKVLKELLV